MRPALPAQFSSETRVRWAAALLFLSGAASLALEVTWTRWLRLAFGSTTWAVSTVLVAYMLGLGLGGLWGGSLARRGRNGWLLYGLLEAGVGVYALLVPKVFSLAPLAQQAWFADWDFWSATLARFALAVVLLTPPTVLMGATLPVLVATVLGASGHGVGRGVGLLYGSNTLGAVAGVLAATFVLFPSLGLTRTNLLAATTDLAIAALAVLYCAKRTGEPSPAVGASPAAPRNARTTKPSKPVPAWLVATVYGSVGFCALAYEVAWTRSLAPTVGSSTYAFGTMLAAFLLGIAAGSLLIRRLADRLVNPLRTFATGLLALAIFGLTSSQLLHRLPDLQPWIFVFFGFSPSGVVASVLTASMLIMLALTVVLGTLFPLLVRALSSHLTAPAATGLLYFTNTLGSALGAFVTGFWAIPAIGLQRTILALATMNALASGLITRWCLDTDLRFRRALSSIALAIAVAVWAIPWPWDPQNLARGVFRFPLDEIDVGVGPQPLEGTKRSELLFYREGWNSLVSVHRVLGELGLRVDGKADASAHGDLPTQVLLGHIGVLFGSKPTRAAVIGLASGVTAGSLALHPNVQVDVIEIEPAMVPASHFFDSLNHRPLEQPNVRLVLDDARSFLAARKGSYDLIVSEPSNPWMSGAANLFTAEFFRSAREALSPQGKLLQWVQVYSIQPEAVAAILRALQVEFPYVYGFYTEPGSPDLLFLSSLEPLTAAGLPNFEEQPASVAADLQRIGVHATADLWSLLRLSPHATAALARRAPVPNSDDNMFVELSTPWSLYDTGALGHNWAVLRPLAEEIVNFWRNAFTGDEPARLATLGLAYLQQNELAIARQLLELARASGKAPENEALALALEATTAKEPGEARARLLPQLRMLGTLLPRSRVISLSLAEWELEQMNFSQALDAANTVLASWPGDLPAQRIRFEALLGLGRFQQAWGEAQRLLASPYALRNHELKVKAAQAAHQSGDLASAERLLWDYLEWYPDSPQEWETLADLYEKLGDRARGGMARRNAEQAKRNVVLELHQQARRLTLIGDRQGAAQRLRTAFLFAPDYTLAREELKALGEP